MSEENKTKILSLAVKDEVLEYVCSFTSDVQVEKISTEDEFDEVFEELTDGVYGFIICGSVLGEEFSTEAAQVLNCQCPVTPIFYITDEKENFRAQDLEKNGFTKAFFYPADKPGIKDSILGSLDADSLKERHFKPIRIMDFEEGDVLGFDTHVFLPLNKKYVHFSSAEDSFSESKAEKLKKHHIGAVHIDHKDAKAFYDYSAKRLKSLGQNDSLSATEREEKLRDAVSGLFSGVFDASQKDSFDTGKSLLGSCQKIVSNYVTGGMSDNWYANLIRTVGSQRGSYSHASEVSTFAALFAIGIQHPNPDDLALAGFLHDISLADFPEELLEQDQSTWDEDHKRSYQEHPQASMNAIKKKKMIINESVEKAILDHHEMFNGQGFPKQKPGDMISDEAQILSFADQFQYLMTVKEGEKRLSPIEAFEKIEETKSINPQILRKIRPLLENPEEK